MRLFFKSNTYRLNFVFIQIIDCYSFRAFGRHRHKKNTLLNINYLTQLWTYKYFDDYQHDIRI